MADTCQSCGSDIPEGSPKVRTETGLICKDCMPAYFASARDPEARAPSPREAPAPDGREALRSETSAETATLEEGDPSGPPDDGAPPDTNPPPEPGPPADDPHNPFATLEDIRRELSEVRQALQFEKSSIWNVGGGIAQCFAVAALIFAAANWGADPKPALLLAILLQLMALTFFFNAR